MFCPRCTIDHPPEICPLNPEFQRKTQEAQEQLNAASLSIDPATIQSFASNLLNTAFDVVTSLPSKAAVEVTGIGGKISSTFAEACDLATETAGNACSAVGDVAASAVEAVGDGASAVLEGAGSVVEAAGDIIGSIADI